MVVFRKVFKDSTLRNLISEYETLRANFNNSNKDYVSFDKSAKELKNKFISVHDNYRDSYRHLIDGYIFNITDFIIRNQRMIDRQNDQNEKNNKGNKKDIELKSNPTIVFANGPLPNVKKNDEE